MDLETPLPYDPATEAKADLFNTLDSFLSVLALLTIIPVVAVVWVMAWRYVF